MQSTHLSTLLKLIANPERMTILLMLLEGDRSISELTDAVGRPASVVSNHLAKLRTAGVIAFTRYHRVIEYRLTSREAAAILRTLVELQAGAAA